MTIESKIRKYALQNAIKFEGKANPGAVIGKIMAEFPEAKKDMKSTSAKINAIISEVNKLGVAAQLEELQKTAPELLEKKEKEEQRGLPELKNAVMGKVITRIPPEPSKYNHLGHAISFLINYIYAQKYKGKCIMRFDDTNPEKESVEYVDAMKEDVLEYLDIKPDEVIFASDHMDKYYEYAEKLVSEGKAYVCSCKSEDISKARREMTECSHRNKPVAEEQKLWKEMREGKFDEGSVTLRLKIDMMHKNAVMRDPVIYRLSYTPHYRQGTKFKVWPMYDFETSIEEGLIGVTHVLRSNEFDSRIELHKYIASLFGFPDVEYKHYGRFSVPGATTKGREIRDLIESGDYIGWDDPRLVTLRALKRRGIVKESYYELAVVAGLSKQETNLDYSVIAAINRQILDKIADRFFFIDHPVEIKIEGTPSKEVKLNLHGDKKDHSRLFSINENFVIAKEDFDGLKDGELYRLMDCINFKKEKGTDGQDRFVFVSEDVETFKKSGKKIIHWLPKDEAVHCDMMMPDAKITHGLCEKNVLKINEHAVIQFERFGFCRLDKHEKDRLTFWFGHK